MGSDHVRHSSQVFNAESGDAEEIRVGRATSNKARIRGKVLLDYSLAELHAGCG